MPELRFNPALKEWVIIAKERSKRPEDFKTGTYQVGTDKTDSCPFCSGHEHLTPPEVLSYREAGTQADKPGWWIRIIPNKYYALSPEGEPMRTKAGELFMSMNGVGRHEVIVESPQHDQTIITMSRKQAEEIFLAYRDRYTELTKDPRFEMIILFKNYGFNAGTSLLHPHSQIIATPVAPRHIRDRIEIAMMHYDEQGACLYCDTIKAEKEAGVRVVLETGRFIVIEPFAARSPFETWILPKEHDSNFEETSVDGCKELAAVVQQILGKISKILNNPDYNYVILSAPAHERGLEYYHWHLKIIPRVSATAGFEIGSGMFINPVIPEEAARYLREA